MGISRADITLGVLFSIFSAAAVTQADSTPYAWWRFDQTGGTTAFDSAGSMHGTLVNGPAWTNGALCFDGVDDYVSLPAHSMDLSQGFSVNLWAKPDLDYIGNVMWPRFFELGNGMNADNIAFGRFYNSHNLVFFCYNGSTLGGHVIAENVIENLKWQMLTATLDSAGNVCIYKNGQLVKTGATGIPRNVVRASNFIGESNWPADTGYRGLMHNLAMYNRVLSAQEIAALYTPVPPVTEVWVDDDYYAGGFNDGHQWTDTAFNNVREAVNAVAANGVVHIAPGTYPLTARIPIELKNGVKLLGAGADVTIIDGTNDDPYGLYLPFSICRAVNCGETTLLEGLTIRNAGSDRWTGHNGAALYTQYSRITVRNCAFVNNTAAAGGAVCNDNSNCRFENCRFADNQLATYSYYGGGAVYNVSGSPRFENCTFEGNSSIPMSGGTGGAVQNQGSSPTFLGCMFTNNIAGSTGGAIAGNCLEIANCTFVGNKASGSTGSGGALYGVNATVENCSFIGNEATGNGGAIGSSTGGIVDCSFVGNKARNGGAVSSYSFISRCTFEGNIATAEGGGVYGLSGSVFACVFTNNSAARGGGLSGQGSGSLVNCVFEGNTASLQGGGAYVMGRPVIDNCLFRANQSVEGGGVYVLGYSEPTFNNCTLVGNTSQSYGGALYSYNSRCALANCILWQNTAAAGDEIYIYDVTGTYIASISHCIITACGGSGAGWDASLGTDAGGNLAGDPLFANAAGGDLRLTAVSPAVDAGNNAAALQAADMDGRVRILDGNCDGTAIVDMGAYEYQAVAGDVNDDCGVDLYDLTSMSGMWLLENCTPCGGADLNLDNKVDLSDLEILAREWLAAN